MGQRPESKAIITGLTLTNTDGFSLMTLYCNCVICMQPLVAALCLSCTSDCVTDELPQLNWQDLAAYETRSAHITAGLSLLGSWDQIAIVASESPEGSLESPSPAPMCS